MLQGRGVQAEAITRLLAESGWGLPTGIAAAVADLLVTVPVDGADVSVSGCSSSRGDFPLTETLTDNEQTWWISAAGSMPRGVGREWLEFSFTCVCCVRFIGIKIPPLPHGPLSVREFHIQKRRVDSAGLNLTDDCESAWDMATRLPLQTLNTARMQEFVFNPAIETNKVRLVCTKTAAAGSLAGLGGVNC